MIIRSAISEAGLLAWGALAAVSFYYFILVLMFRWHSERTVVTRYEPPAGISPSMAAYLCQDGECERAFAVGIISLASRRYLRVYASGEQFRIIKIRDADSAIPADETALLSALFPKHNADCAFGGTDPGSLEQALNRFREVMSASAQPGLLSRHTVLWGMGLICSGMYLPLLASSFHTGAPIASLIYLSIWVLLGVVCLIAALRVWPATLRKIISRLPGVNQPRVRFKYSDANPIFLTMSACAGFGLLAAETSATFGALVGMTVVIVWIARQLLDVPTRKGRRVLAELRDFKEFLMRTEADKLSRGVQVRDGQLQFENYSAYAVALEVERGWGEEFATQLMQTVEFDHAYSFSPPPIDIDAAVPQDHFLQLNLRRKQEPSEKT